MTIAAPNLPFMKGRFGAAILFLVMPDKLPFPKEMNLARYGGL